MNEDNPDSVICHRGKESFWRVLFKQNINLSNPIRVIWAGEDACNDGGPFREFLFYSMVNLYLLSCHFFGSSNNLFFSSNTDALIKNQYFLLGQLGAMGLIYIGKGQHCLHLATAEYLLLGTVSSRYDINVDDGEYVHLENSIKKGNKNVLYDAHIVLTNDANRDIESFKKFYFIYKRAAAIDQYKKGIESVAAGILEYPCCVMKYFIAENVNLKPPEVRSPIKFTELDSIGSKGYIEKQEAVVTLELFLAELEKAVEDLNFGHFLRFVTGTDRIPLLGFKKNIEVLIVEDNKFPRAATCGLLLGIPENVTREMLIFT